MGDIKDTRTAQDRQEQQVRMDKDAKRLANIELVNELQTMIRETGPVLGERLSPNSPKSVAIDNSGKDPHQVLTKEFIQRLRSEAAWRADRNTNCGDAGCYDEAKAQALKNEMVPRRTARNKWDFQEKSSLLESERLQLKALAGTFEKWAKDNDEKIRQSTDPDNLIDPVDLLASVELFFAESAAKLAEYAQNVTTGIATDELNFDWFWGQMLMSGARNPDSMTTKAQPADHAEPAGTTKAEPAATQKTGPSKADEALSSAKKLLGKWRR
jgi:hypothetical protein